MNIQHKRMRRGIRSRLTYWYLNRRYRIVLGYGLTKAQEQEASSQVISRLVTTVLRPSRMDCTFSDFTPIYLKYMLARRRVDIKRNEFIIKKHLCPFFGSRVLKTLNLEDGIDYVNLRSRQNAADGTIEREFVVIMAILNLAVDTEYLDKNRLRRTPVPTYEPRSRVATPTELNAIIAASMPDLQRVIQIALNTGLRQSKVLGIDELWMRRQPDGPWLQLPKPHTMYKGNPLKIPLNRLATEALRVEVPRIHNGRIFKRWKDTSSFRRVWARARDRAGLQDFHFHDLRHTFATRLQEVGVDYEVRAALLGHKIKGVTGLYSHGGPEWDNRLREAVKRLEGFTNTLAASPQGPTACAPLQE